MARTGTLSGHRQSCERRNCSTSLRDNYHLDGLVRHWLDGHVRIRGEHRAGQRVDRGDARDRAAVAAVGDRVMQFPERPALALWAETCGDPLVDLAVIDGDDVRLAGVLDAEPGRGNVERVAFAGVDVEGHRRRAGCVRGRELPAL